MAATLRYRSVVPASPINVTTATTMAAIEVINIVIIYSEYVIQN